MPNYTETRKTVTQAADMQLVGPSPKRVAIIFPAPPTNAYTVTTGPAAVLNEGITLYPLGQPVILSKVEHGDAVTRAWRAISAVANQVVVVGESYE